MSDSSASSEKKTIFSHIPDNWKKKINIGFAALFIYMIFLLIDTSDIFSILHGGHLQDGSVYILISAFTQLLFVFIISTFFGSAISNVIYELIMGWAQKIYDKLDNTIKKSQENKSGFNWQQFVSFFETHEYNNLNTSISNLQLTNEKLVLPEFESNYAAISNLNNIVHLMLDIEVEISQHRPSKNDYNDFQKIISQLEPLKAQRANIRRSLASIRFLMALARLMPLLLVSLIFYGILSATEYVYMDSSVTYIEYYETLKYLGVGIVFILSTYNVTRFVYSVIKLFAVYTVLSWGNRVSGLVFKLIIAVTLPFIVLGIIWFGVFNIQKSVDISNHTENYNVGTVSQLNQTNATKNALGGQLIEFWEMVKILVAPSAMQKHHEHKWIGDAYGYLLVIRIITAISLAYIMISVLLHYSREYESNFFDREKGHGLVPPELMKIFGIFAIFVLVAGHIYLSVLSFSADWSADLSHQLSEKARESTDNLKESDTTVKLTNVVSNNDADTNSSGLKQLVPFSVFIALLGTGVALATREILENYFSGLALRVDHPFAKGDRVHIKDVGMCEVMEKSLRVTKLYVIHNNSVAYVPHKEMASLVVENYHQPTLDYRKEISLYIPVVENETLENNNESVLKHAEAALLMAAMVAAGVIRPKPEYLEFEELPDYKAHNIEIKDKEAVRKDKFDKKFNLSAKACKKEVSHELIERIKRRLDDYTFKNKVKFRKNILMEASSRFASTGRISRCWANKIWNARFHETQHEQPRHFSRLLVEELNKLMEEGVFKHKEELFARSREGEIKQVLAKIVLGAYEFDRKLKDWLGDKYLNEDNDEKRLLKKLSDVLKGKNLDDARKHLLDISQHAIDVSYEYFSLAKRLWEFRYSSTQTSQATIRKLDHVAVRLLDAPRVTCSHMLTEDGFRFWEAKLIVTLELSEQSDEIIHHINLLIDQLWSIFKLGRGRPQTYLPKKEVTPS